MKKKDLCFFAIIAVAGWVLVLFSCYIYPISTADGLYNTVMGCTVLNILFNIICSCYVISRCAKPDSSDQKPKGDAPTMKADEHHTDF